MPRAPGLRKRFWTESASRQFCKTGSRHSSIPSPRGGFVKAYHERCESLAATKLFAQLVRGVFSGNLADTHPIVQAVRRIVLLNENRRIGKIQAVAQALCIGLIAKRADLHGKKSASRIDTRRQDFHAHGNDARSD